MELKLYQKDIERDVKNIPIDNVEIEDFNIFNKIGIWSFDRITYHCPTGFIKYLKHEDKNLIGKIGIENVSEESLKDYDENFSIPTRKPFLDGIYDEYDELSNRQVLTEFVERRSISYEEYLKERNRLWNIRHYDLSAKLEKALVEIRPKFVEEMDISKYVGKREYITVDKFKHGSLELDSEKKRDFFTSECIGFNFEEYEIFQKQAEELHKINLNEELEVLRKIEALYSAMS